MGHLVLALPDGRLHRPYERRVVALLYAAPLITQIVRYVAEYPPQPQGWGDPHAAYSAWAAVGSVTELALTVVTIALVIRRWSEAGRPVRRAYTLVWVTIVAMGCAVAADAVAGLFDVPITVQQDLLLAYALGLAVPFILSALAFSTFSGVFRFFRDHYGAITLVSGLVLIVMGVLLFSGVWDHWMNYLRLEFANVGIGSEL